MSDLVSKLRDKPNENHELLFNTIFKDAKPRNFNIPCLDIADDLLLNYFVNNLSKETVEKIPSSKFDLKSIIATDYYSGFNDKCNDTSNMLKELDFDNVISYCCNNMKNYIISKSSKIEISPYEKYNINAKFSILASAYVNFINNKELQTLIKDASNINELKAILFIDCLYKDINNERKESILKRDISTEQKAIELTKVYPGETNIKSKNEISRIITQSNNNIRHYDSFIEEYTGLIDKLERLDETEVTPLQEVNYLLNKKKCLESFEKESDSHRQNVSSRLKEINEKIEQIKQKDYSLIKLYVDRYQNRKNLQVVEAIKVSRKLGEYERICKVWDV